MSKLVNNEGKNKLNKTYELFENSVKELNKLISYKTLDEYNVFLGFLKGRKNTFDKAVGEAIDAVYVKGILDEEDIVTGCPTDIVKFNKDYKTSKTKELIESGLVEEDIEMGKKNMIEESVKNNNVGVSILNKEDKTFKDVLLLQVDAMKEAMNQAFDKFEKEIRDKEFEDASILNVKIGSELFKQVEEKSKEFIPSMLQDNSVLCDIVEPVKEFSEMVLKSDGIELQENGNVIISDDSILANLLYSLICVESNGENIVVSEKESVIGGKTIKGKLNKEIVKLVMDEYMKDIHEDVEELNKSTKEFIEKYGDDKEVKKSIDTNNVEETKPEKTEDVKSETVKVNEAKETVEDKTIEPEKKPEVTALSYKITKSNDKISLDINSTHYEIIKTNNATTDALAIVGKMLDYANLSAEYSIVVLANYSKDLVLDLLTGKYDNFKLSSLILKDTLEQNAKLLLA